MFLTCYLVCAILAVIILFIFLHKYSVEIDLSTLLTIITLAVVSAPVLIVIGIYWFVSEYILPLIFKPFKLLIKKMESITIKFGDKSCK